MKEINEFFAFVNERQRITLRKAKGLPRDQWTNDPVLQEFRFCNIFREDDKTTKFFRDTVRGPLRNDSCVLEVTIGWRWFNRIETCGSAKWWQLLGWSRDHAERDFRPIQQSKVPLVTGAYLVNTPSGVDKLTGILNCMDIVMDQKNAIHSRIMKNRTLQEAHLALTEIPFLGPFMAYEVVTDLRHTYLLENAPDINSWASAGPGCCRGAGWVNSSNSGEFNYGTKRSQSNVLALMNTILWQSQKLWDWPDRPWEMREVEHSLCEYDKYRRAQGGQRLKRKYKS